MVTLIRKRFHVIAVLMMALVSVTFTSSAMARGGFGHGGGFGGHGGFYGGGFYGGYGYGFPYWYGPYDYGYPYGPYGYGYPDYYGPGAYSTGCYIQHRPVYSKRKHGHIIGYRNVRVCPVPVPR